MTGPLVTIITPTYNCARYLPETIESVLRQNYLNLDYIVLDDGSTDDTLALLAHYGDVLSSCRHRNMGEQKTVNKGLQGVQGKYFMVVNADDPLLPGAVSAMVNYMESHPNVLCAYPDWNVINEDGSIRVHVQTREWDFAWMVRHHTCIPGVGSIFRSSILQAVGYRDTSFRWVGDFDYWFRVGLAGPMARVPLTLANWRWHDGQATQQKSLERAAEHVRVMEKFFRLPAARPLKRYEGQAKCWSHIVAGCVTVGRREQLKQWGLAVRHYPCFLISWDCWVTVFGRLLYVLRRYAFGQS